MENSITHLGNTYNEHFSFSFKSTQSVLFGSPTDEVIYEISLSYGENFDFIKCVLENYSNDHHIDIVVLFEGYLFQVSGNITWITESELFISSFSGNDNHCFKMEPANA